MPEHGEKVINESAIADSLIFDTRQQAADSTSSTARRGNAVAKVKLIRYINV